MSVQNLYSRDIIHGNEVTVNLTVDLELEEGSEKSNPVLDDLHTYITNDVGV